MKVLVLDVDGNISVFVNTAKCFYNINIPFYFDMSHVEAEEELAKNGFLENDIYRLLIKEVEN